MDYDIEAPSDPTILVVTVYDSSPFKEYVRLIKVGLLRTREALAQALEDHAHAENKIME